MAASVADGATATRAEPPVGLEVAGIVVEHCSVVEAAPFAGDDDDDAGVDDSLPSDGSLAPA